MGASYGHITLNTERPLLIDICRELELSAYVSPAERGWVTVFEKQCDGNMKTVLRLCSMLSSSLRCKALGISVHDDSVFEYVVLEGSDEKDAYCSCPDYFEDSDGAKPEIGSPQILADIFGATVEAIQGILSYDKAEQYRLVEAGVLSEDAIQYVFESERHLALNRCLGLPAFCGSYGFSNFRFGDVPAGYTPGDFTKV